MDDFLEDDANIEWKKKKGKKEIVTLETNVLEANLFQAKAKNKPTVAGSGPENIKAQLPKDLRKIRKKIRDVFDDDDDDEENEIFEKSLDMEMLEFQNSLLGSLNAQEKQALKQHSVVQNTVQAAQANKLMLSMGLKKLSQKAFNANINNNAIGADLSKQILMAELKYQKGLNLKNLNERQKVQALRGINRLMEGTKRKQLEDLSLKKVITIGAKNKTDKEVAEIILEKTGRKEDAITKTKINKTYTKEFSKTLER